VQRCEATVTEVSCLLLPPPFRRAEWLVLDYLRWRAFSVAHAAPDPYRREAFPSKQDRFIRFIWLNWPEIATKRKRHVHMVGLRHDRPRKISKKEETAATCSMPPS